MANSVDPDQTAPIGAVCSGSTLFASILNSSVMLGNYLKQPTTAEDFSRRHFRIHFFLGALRVKNFIHLLKTASDYFSHLLKVLINLLISILKMNVEHLFSSYIVNEKI